MGGAGRRLAASVPCALAVLACASVPAPEPPAPVPVSLAALQGGWWSDCADPAVEFFIEGASYAGDFLGEHPLELRGDILVFREGLVAGHGVEVSHQPLSFRVVRVEGGQLVLRPLPGNPRVGDWRLRACEPGP